MIKNKQFITLLLALVMLLSMTTIANAADIEGGIVVHFLGEYEFNPEFQEGYQITKDDIVVMIPDTWEEIDDYTIVTGPLTLEDTEIEVRYDNGTDVLIGRESLSVVPVEQGSEGSTSASGSTAVLLTTEIPVIDIEYDFAVVFYKKSDGTVLTGGTFDVTNHSKTGQIKFTSANLSKQVGWNLVDYYTTDFSNLGLDSTDYAFIINNTQPDLITGDIDVSDWEYIANGQTVNYTYNGDFAMQSNPLNSVQIGLLSTGFGFVTVDDLNN